MAWKRTGDRKLAEPMMNQFIDHVSMSQWKMVMRLQFLNNNYQNRQRSRGTMMTSSNGNIFRATGHLSGEFTGHRWIPRTKAGDRSFDVFFDLRLHKRLSKQWRGWWFESPSRSLWRHSNVILDYLHCHLHYTKFEHRNSIVVLWFGCFDTLCSTLSCRSTRKSLDENLLNPWAKGNLGEVDTTWACRYNRRWRLIYIAFGRLGETCTNTRVVVGKWQ